MDSQKSDANFYVIVSMEPHGSVYVKRRKAFSYFTVRSCLDATLYETEDQASKVIREIYEERKGEGTYFKYVTTISKKKFFKAKLKQAK